MTDAGGMTEAESDAGQGEYEADGGTQDDAEDVPVADTPFRELVWAKKTDGSGTQTLKALRVEPNDDVIIGADVDGSINFGEGKLTSAGRSDVAIARLNASGAHIWSNIFGDTETQSIYDLDTSTNGGITISGSTYGPINFGGDIVQGQANGAAFIANIVPPESTTSGWALGFAPEGTAAVSIAQREGFIIAGIHGYWPETEPWSTRILASITPAGNVEREIGLFNQRLSRASDIEFDTKGNVLIGGAFSEPVEFCGITPPSRPRAFVASLLPDGGCRWARSFDTSLISHIESVGEMVVISGTFQGEDQPNFGSGRQNCDASRNTCTFIAAFTTDGAFDWLVTGYGQGFSAMATSDDSIIVAGDAGDATALGDIMLPPVPIHMGGRGIVAALNLRGNIKWIRTIDSRSSHTLSIPGIGVFSDGSVLLGINVDNVGVRLGGRDYVAEGISTVLLARVRP